MSNFHSDPRTPHASPKLAPVVRGKKREILDTRGTTEKASHRRNILLTDADVARLEALAEYLKPAHAEFPNTSATVRWAIQFVYDAVLGEGEKP